MSWENILKQIDEFEAIFGKITHTANIWEIDDVKQLEKIEDNVRKFKREVIDRYVNFMKGLEKIDYWEDIGREYYNKSPPELKQSMREIKNLERWFDNFLYAIVDKLGEIGDVRSELEYERKFPRFDDDVPEYR